jgi:hypothetical protein
VIEHMPDHDGFLLQVGKHLTHLIHRLDGSNDC